MDQKLTLVVIEGSARDHRESIKAARYVENLARQLDNVEVIFADPTEFAFPNDGNNTEGKDPHYTEIVTNADAFFIVTPEYNHSYPGTLKRMLDSEYKAYFRKPVALAGVSNGNWGGARVVESLLPVMRSLGLFPLQYTTYFPYVQDIFDENGQIKPEREAEFAKSVNGQLTELVWLARTLKWGRDNLVK